MSTEPDVQDQLMEQVRRATDGMPVEVGPIRDRIRSLVERLDTVIGSSAATEDQRERSRNDQLWLDQFDRCAALLDSGDFIEAHQAFDRAVETRTAGPGGSLDPTGTDFPWRLPPSD